jgi:hypothetical protein
LARCNPATCTEVRRLCAEAARLGTTKGRLGKNVARKISPQSV